MSSSSGKVGFGPLDALAGIPGGRDPLSRLWNGVSGVYPETSLTVPGVLAAISAPLVLFLQRVYPCHEENVDRSLDGDILTIRADLTQVTFWPRFRLTGFSRHSTL